MAEREGDYSSCHCRPAGEGQERREDCSALWQQKSVEEIQQKSVGEIQQKSVGEIQQKSVGEIQT